MGVRIITDTGCDLPPKLERQFNIEAIPFFFHFGLEAWRDKTMPMRDFLAKARETWPKTAAPSTEEFTRVFRKGIEAGDQVLCLPITSKHSATYAAAVTASRQFPSEDIAVIDSLSLSIGQGILALVAARAAQEKQKLADIVDLVKGVRERLQVFITLNTIEYLVLGGRASRLNGLLAGLLKIRPILTLQEGELTVLKKPRGRQASKCKLIDLVKQYLPAEILAVGHVACEAEARALAMDLASRTGFPEEDILLVETGMALATHGGPGTLGIAVVSN